MRLKNLHRGKRKRHFAWTPINTTNFSLTSSASSKCEPWHNPSHHKLQQMVKVIWHRPHRRHRQMVQSYSPGGANVPPTWAHWHHLANMTEIVYIGAIWRIWLNLCFLRPIWVHNPNGKSISSAVSAQLMAECPYTFQWVTLSPKFPLLTGALNPI